MGFSFNRISDFFVVVVVIVVVVQEVLHERGFSELGASRAKNVIKLHFCIYSIVDKSERGEWICG